MAHESKSISAYIITLAVLLAACFADASAQIPSLSRQAESEPITWKASARMTSPTQGVITITADMAAGWHLYGLEMPEDGPRPTTITIGRQKDAGYTLTGKLTADKVPVAREDPMFGIKVNFWEKKVTFTRGFRISDTTKPLPQIPVTVSFMGCNDRTCRPPETKELKVSIAPFKK